jgi:hypothetical protein
MVKLKIFKKKANRGENYIVELSRYSVSITVIYSKIFCSSFRWESFKDKSSLSIRRKLGSNSISSNKTATDRETEEKSVKFCKGTQEYQLGHLYIH